MFGLQQKLCKGIFDDSKVLNSTCAVYYIFKIIIELHRYDLLIKIGRKSYNFKNYLSYIKKNTFRRINFFY